jgi:hypothetical protein
MKRVACPEFQCVIARQFGSTAERFLCWHGDYEMLLGEFAHPRSRLFDNLGCYLTHPELDRGSRSKLDQCPLADREALAGGLDPIDDSVGLRFANEHRNQRAGIDVHHQYRPSRRISATMGAVSF